jgi:protein-S-isoprenylcysteine O-methyltransferase
MNPLFPTPAMLLAILLISERFLMRGRMSSDRQRTADRGSLRLLLVVIIASIGLAWIAARLFPQASLASLFALDASAARRLYEIGLAVFAAGLGLRWLAIAWLGRLFTFDVAIAADHRVIDTGPYRLIRHPAYTGSLLSYVGLGLCAGNAVSLGVLVVPIAVAFLRRIAIEEAALASALGPSYMDYAGRTKRLIPFVY